MMKMTKDKVLSDLKIRYNTPGDPLYLSGISTIKNEYRNVSTLKDITDFLAKSRTYTTHFEFKPPVHNPYYIRRVRQMMQVDLTEISKISKYNDGFKFLLVAIGM